LDHSYQLDFIDSGFMPVVEEEAGKKLTELVGRIVTGAKSQLLWKEITPADGCWLLKATFWLLAAKILQDKQVSGFRRLRPCLSSYQC
jgi:hypothetical protein